MKNKLYTIGFTKKTAEYFFELLTNNGIELVLDIRLNNTSQLAAFSKYPDIKFFLKKMLNIDYIHDTTFSPDENTLKEYKKKHISWEEYIVQFDETMHLRNIKQHIKMNYLINKKICLLCSEPTADKCHRKLIAKQFKEIDNKLDIIHL